jgi:hypothetical protein
VSREIMSHLLENNLIYETQSGFMSNDSTCDQLIKISNDILELFEKGNEVMTVFMDISKAFDKVLFRGLLVKLENNGISGGLLN